MDRWEHRTVYISRTGQEWSVQFADGDRLVGIDRILDEYGGRGWELVTFAPQTWETRAGQYGPFDVSAYRAVFKRRLADGAEHDAGRGPVRGTVQGPAQGPAASRAQEDQS